MGLLMVLLLSFSVLKEPQVKVSYFIMTGKGFKVTLI